MDGGLSRNGEVGASAPMCRGTDGCYLGSSSIVLPGLTEPATLEVLASCEALALAEDLALTKIIIACDSKTIVDDINEGKGGAYEAIVKKINSMASYFVSYLVIFEVRSSNCEAHNLAKHSAILDQGRHLWLIHPHDPACIPINIHIDQVLAILKKGCLQRRLPRQLGSLEIKTLL